MYTQAQYEQHDEQPVEDHIVHLSGIRWEDCQLPRPERRGFSRKTDERLPGLDLELLTAFLDRPTTYDAIRAYRDALRN